MQAQGNWDLDTQEFHGGQSWRSCDNFVEDFSVTTNAFGAPAPAVEAARKALTEIHHYPAADAAEATAALARFCNWPASRMLIGNGASEFIDLLMKSLPEGPFVPAPYIATYQEYHRAARAAERTIVDRDTGMNDAAISVYIRPNSPTGELASLKELTDVLETTKLSIIVDESFLPFAGPSWRSMSALSLIDRFPSRLIVLHSWTKLFSCPGIRLGSVCASTDWIKRLKSLQTPWSCNLLAQSFAIAAANDKEYLEQTWRCLPQWKRVLLDNIKQMGWKVLSNPSWVPWTFVECPSKEVAAMASKVALSVGCPIRLGASYGLPTHVRIAVRKPDHQNVLFDALRQKLAPSKGKGMYVASLNNGLAVNAS